jgi:hypothetical protein
MALQSPGVQVSVIDESFYTPAEPGTTPLIFIATKQNKPNPSNTGIAPGTLAANAGKVYAITSQRELSETFGDAIFYRDANNNPINGGEQNEYGLQAAYSYLGVSNRAYVVRANLDTGTLDPKSEAPKGNPIPGTYWFDLQETFFGIFSWNASSVAAGGQKFTNEVPIKINRTNQVVNFAGGNYTPRAQFGRPGSYAVVTVTDTPKIWYKNTENTWVVVGSREWKASLPVVTGSVSSPSLTAGHTLTFITVGGAQIGYDVEVPVGETITAFVEQINAVMATTGTGFSAKVVNNRIALYNSGEGGWDAFEISGTPALLTALGITAKTYYAPKLSIQTHTQVPEYKLNDTVPRPSGSVWIKTTVPNLGANWVVKSWNNSTLLWDTVAAPIYNNNHHAIYMTDRNRGGLNIPDGALYVQSNIGETADPEKLADFKVFRRNGVGATTVTSIPISTNFPVGVYQFTLKESRSGSQFLVESGTLSFTSVGNENDAASLTTIINNAGLQYVTASVDSSNRITITHSQGGEIRFVEGANNPIEKIFTPYDENNNASTVNFYVAAAEEGDGDTYVATKWKALNYISNTEAPSTIAEDGTLWYNSIIDEVDIMINDGTRWVGYKNYSTAYQDTNPTGPMVGASQPSQQSDGSPLAEGDLWIDTSDLENYPGIYRYSADLEEWILVDKTDQTTENGIIFADARAGSSGGTATEEPTGSIAGLLTDNYVDPDAPDPALYPKGMMLWNLRRSGFNVKRLVRNYINTGGRNTRFNNQFMSNYYPHRWVSEAANNVDGSGCFGRQSQRKVVVQSLQSLVAGNQDIRDDESRIFNLMACPGYPELIGEMISLNYDRGLSAFVVGDSPMRLKPNSSSIEAWAANINQAVEDNDLGLVSRDEYLGVYYPSGFTTDNFGFNVVVPASHIVLRTIALNDQVGYPWFAPAGTRRGGVTNASAVGYISDEGEFVSTALNEGQRDILYLNNVNPITFLNGAGLVVYGQKTRARNASALDRVNVARLVVYLRSQLKKLAKPFTFEPNDKITRDEIKQQVESLMVELTGLRAIYDYLVVCDESNNTPSRIDRNELYIDIAVEPVKAIEFIYIPLRLKNTGEISGS